MRIVGTSHIAPESVRAVERIVRGEKPDFVAVELDRKRFVALAHGIRRKPSLRDIRRVGVKGWLFALIGAWMEHKLGKRVGSRPGDEMMRAVSVAKEVGAHVFLIDQDFEVTLRRFGKALSWKEKLRFVWDVLKAVVFRKGAEFDISKVPPKKLIEKLLKDVKKRYPNVYRVLVEERNEFMAKRLAHLQAQFPDGRVVAVVGAGHAADIRKLLKKYLKKDMH